MNSSEFNPDGSSLHLGKTISPEFSERWRCPATKRRWRATRSLKVDSTGDSLSPCLTVRDQHATTVPLKTTCEEREDLGRLSPEFIVLKSDLLDRFPVMRSKSFEFSLNESSTPSRKDLRLRLILSFKSEHGTSMKVMECFHWDLSFRGPVTGSYPNSRFIQIVHTG